jgi:hypothetical protein
MEASTDQPLFPLYPYVCVGVIDGRISNGGMKQRMLFLRELE